MAYLSVVEYSSFELYISIMLVLFACGVILFKLDSIDKKLDELNDDKISKELDELKNEKDSSHR